MKKKLIAALLTTGMCLSMTACGSADTPQENTNTEITSEPQETQSTENDAIENNTTEEVNTPVEDNNVQEDNGAPSGETLGQTLYNVFVNFVAENPDASSTDIADALLADEHILFAGMSMPVEAGYLAGFPENEISGFEEGTMFSPMIGSIPFVGYVFVLADEADAEDFMATLAENADPRWNICTEADETIIESVGNKVFFLMCPSSMDGE